MTSVPTMPAVAPLLEDFSLEMTGKDVRKLEEARAVQWHSEDRVIRSGSHTIVFA